MFTHILPTSRCRASLVASALVLILIAIIFPVMHTNAALAGNVEKNWLEVLYPSINRCEPSTPLYYDDASKSSINGFLEKKGYRAFNITNEVAEYRIDEHFFGMHAYDLMLPRHMSYMSIGIDAPIDDVRRRLEFAYGTKIALYDRDDDPPEIASLFAKEPGKTSFTCSSEPE